MNEKYENMNLTNLSGTKASDTDLISIKSVPINSVHFVNDFFANVGIKLAEHNKGEPDIGGRDYIIIYYTKATFSNVLFCVVGYNS